MHVGKEFMSKGHLIAVAGRISRLAFFVIRDYYPQIIKINIIYIIVIISCVTVALANPIIEISDRLRTETSNVTIEYDRDFKRWIHC